MLISVELSMKKNYNLGAWSYSLAVLWMKGNLVIDIKNMLFFLRLGFMQFCINKL